MRNLRLSPVKVGGGGGSGYGGGVLGCLLLFVLLFSSSLVTLTQAKRSACWRYGHSCWGGHGKRSGDGMKDATDADTTRGSPRLPMLVGPLDNYPGRTVPLRVLSQLLRNNGESYHHQKDLTNKVLLVRRPQSPPQLLSPSFRVLHNKAKREDGMEFGRSLSQDLSDEEKSGTGESESSPFSSLAGIAADNSIFVRDRKSVDFGGGEDLLSSGPAYFEQKPPQERVMFSKWGAIDE